MDLFNKYLLIGFLFIFGYMTCFKVSHRKKIHALKAGYAIKCKGKVSARTDFRAYYCKSCNAWHLTTLTIEQYESNLTKNECKRIKGNAK